MATPFDHYPYTNFHELNLSYFIVHLREIFAQWDQLYSDMLSWKEATDADLADWKAGVLSDIDAWETALNTSLEGWKADTESDITGWMNDVIDSLDAWKAAFQTLFDTTFSNLSDIKTDAEAARDAAIAAQTAAETAAASVTASAAQIGINTADIAALMTTVGDGLSSAEKTPGYIDESVWTVTNSTRHFVIPVIPGSIVTITGAVGHNTPIAMLRSYSIPANNDPVDYSTDTDWTAVVNVGSTATRVFTVPSDAYYMFVYCGNNSPAFDNRLPASIVINGYDYMATITSNLSKLDAKIESTKAAIYTDMDALRPEVEIPVTEVGSISYTDGTNAGGSNRRRSGYLADNLGTVFSDASNGLFAAFAYLKSNDHYVGILKNEDDVLSFGVPADNANVLWSRSLDINYLRQAYPLCKFRFLYRRSNGDVPTAEELHVTNLLRESEKKVAVWTTDPALYFVKGSINADTGANASSSSRYRTVEYVGANVEGVWSTSPDGRFYLYAYDTDGSYVGMYTVASASFTTSGSMLYNINMAAMRAAFPGYTFRIVYRTYSAETPETPSVSQIVFTNAEYDHTPITIRVMQYNIGRFDYGEHNEGLTEEEYEEKLPNYKRFFADYQPMILGLEEWEPYMDAAHLHDSDQVLFDPLFPYSKHNDHTAIKAAYPILAYSTGVLTPELESSYRVPYTMAVFMINGKKVGMISSALKMGPKSGDTPEDVIPIRAAQLAYEMQLLAGYDYAIICNDLNCQTVSERDDMKTQIAAAGFTIANGGYFPDEKTYASQITDYYIDNILTKGLTLRNFTVLADAYSDLSSDHYPVFADYVI